jgi:hypothetical protein
VTPPTLQYFEMEKEKTLQEHIEASKNKSKTIAGEGDSLHPETPCGSENPLVGHDTGATGDRGSERGSKRSRGGSAGGYGQRVAVSLEALQGIRNTALKSVVSSNLAIKAVGSGQQAVLDLLTRAYSYGAFHSNESFRDATCTLTQMGNKVSFHVQAARNHERDAHTQSRALPMTQAFSVSREVNSAYTHLKLAIAEEVRLQGWQAETLGMGSLPIVDWMTLLVPAAVPLILYLTPKDQAADDAAKERVVVLEAENAKYIAAGSEEFRAHAALKIAHKQLEDRYLALKIDNSRLLSSHGGPSGPSSSSVDNKSANIWGVHL